MNNEFNLIFNNSMSNLTGNTFGRKAFEQQIGNKINYNERIVIRFPDAVDNIGVSFIQGFFEPIIKNIGLSGLKDNVDIVSNRIDDIKEVIVKKLLL